MSASVADVVRLHDCGVSLAFVQHVREHGYGNLSVDDIIKLSMRGIR